MDYEVQKIVGLETYKALYSVWPKLYSEINYPMKPDPFYVQLVRDIASSSGSDLATLGPLIRDDLIRMTKGGESSRGYGAGLVNTSPVCTHFTPRPIITIISIIWVLVWTIFVCLFLYHIGFVSKLFSYDIYHSGLGISLIRFF